jgi:2-iminobutanoate/2-iminopropanoate deaminase
MPIEAVTTDKVPPSPNPFSFGIKANGFLFVSGQVGKDGSGSVVNGFEAQVTQALENLKAIVEAGGTSLDKVVKVVIYVTDIKRVPDLNPIYRQYFTGTLPARAAVEVSGLGGKAEVEIEAVALLE